MLFGNLFCANWFLFYIKTGRKRLNLPLPPQFSFMFFSKFDNYQINLSKYIGIEGLAHNIEKRKKLNFISILSSID